MLHSLNFVHRDIKPDNFLIGIVSRRTNDHIYIIDFGLSKRFRNAVTHEHIPYGEGRSLVGTSRYASLTAQMGVEQSRRDDLEGIGLMLVYFLLGKLPWQGISHKTLAGKNIRTRDCKMQTPVEVLCSNIPEEFAKYLNYCRSLQFEGKPDYAYLKKLFRTLFFSMGFTNDTMFDWKLKGYVCVNF